MSVTRTLLIATMLGFLPAHAAVSTDDAAPFEAIAKDYDLKVRPLLKQYCLKCHSTELQEGELDLERFAKLEQVRRDPRAWQKVVEMIDNGEMPPKKKPQPSDTERKQIRDWVRGYLDAEGRASAGDPGSVVLRRLSNVEYDNTVRDLTGVDLRPAREFPVDGAAGEGFTNVGEALVMSPAMLDKYVAAAKGIAAHAVLLPDSIRFSEKTTRRDWTEEYLASIRDIYRRHTDPEGSTRVNLQGLQWDTNSGGRIPLELYLAATIKYRELNPQGSKPIAVFAAENNLSPKYLTTLWDLFHGQDDSPLVGQVREHWKVATSADIPRLAAEIRQWQAALTKFGGVAHFKPWMEPISPLVEARDIRLKLEAKPNEPEIVVHMVTRDAGDGASGDVVKWADPRLEMPGRAPILLRDLRSVLSGLAAKRRTLSEAAKYLDAVEEVRTRPAPIDVDAVAKGRNLDSRMLEAWLSYLGVVGRGRLKIDGLFTERIENSGGNAAVKGWGTAATPNMVANSSGEDAHVPGLVKPHGIAVHPSPTQNVAVGWLSPIAGEVRLEPRAVHAHPACGNGVTWSLELRRDGERRKLAGGDLNVGGSAKIGPVERLRVQEGDLVSLLVGPSDGNHSCDLTEIDLTIVEASDAKRKWTLSDDVSQSIAAGNPHADSSGRPGVWHFYQETIKPGNGAMYATIPAGSTLALWRDEPDRAVRDKVASQLQRLLTDGPPARADDPNADLYRQLMSLSGPLLGKIDFGQLAAEPVEVKTDGSNEKFGLPRERFGKAGADVASLFTTSPSVVELRLPADFAAGREFVTSASLAPSEGAEGSAQVQAFVGPVPAASGLLPDVPIVIRKGSRAHERFEKSLAEFRRVFPAALCYAQIVPVDEVVTLVLFHRDDEALARLMLDDEESRKLDRLWDELRYVSQDALKVQEAYGQFMEYVTQDGDVRLFEPLRKPIAERAAKLRARLSETEPKHVDALVDFASKAYRRPLSDTEQAGLRALYAHLREEKLDHEAAFRLTLARVLLAPAFLYRGETSPPGKVAQAVTDVELASRLSYFLWSSMPDDELRRLATEKKLDEPDVLAAQARRMLNDDRARSLATEFACQWLDIRGFDLHNEKSDQTFPEFAKLRGAMYEESVRFLADLFARNGSILDVLDADHTFVNGPLAQHYGLPGVSGPEWRRVDGVKAHNRGGILGMATLLSKQSGASRTSPVLRGNWLSEMLLGEKLPKPPKNVPQLPESELDTNGLTMRQITEKHRAVEACAKCHDKIDPFGFALEGFDAIGRRREKDLAGRPVDTRAELKDGTKFADIAGLREYLLTKRRDDFLKHFCRKLLGYSLGRAVQLSDEPLLAEMQAVLTRNDHHVQAAIETILRSPQFRERRGLESPLDRDTFEP
jgi:Protein of unknown function (DUF1592)/Protein of unknown function (DUF1588)/Protein of unknown function (DUF1587)/Protein of unknown function (DUF1585)/Protein of unknown function (DUF1595)/Cytochrome C oxidase, cbb3-type, subunit III